MERSLKTDATAAFLFCQAPNDGGQVMPESTVGGWNIFGGRALGGIWHSGRFSPIRTACAERTLSH